MLGQLAALLVGPRPHEGAALGLGVRGHGLGAVAQVPCGRLVVQVQGAATGEGLHTEMTRQE